MLRSHRRQGRRYCLLQGIDVGCSEQHIKSPDARITILWVSASPVSELMVARGEIGADNKVSTTQWPYLGGLMYMYTGPAIS